MTKSRLMKKVNFVAVSKQENVTVFFSCFKGQDLVLRKLTFQIFSLVLLH